MSRASGTYGIPGATPELAAPDWFPRYPDYLYLAFTNATAFTPGTVVSSTLNPAIGTVFYKFNANAGDSFYFDGLQASGFDYPPYCRIYAPAENGVMGQPVNGDQDTFTLLQSGTYTLTVEGRIYETKTSGTFAFNLVPNPPLTPNQFSRADSSLSQIERIALARLAELGLRTGS